MTDRDEIIRIAREAGAGEPESLFGRTDYVVMTRYDLERFAALVSDHMIRNGYRKCAEGQRETQFCGQLEAAVAGAITAEREACAKVCDEIAQQDETGYGIAEDCAAAIRARGNV